MRSFEYVRAPDLPAAIAEFARRPNSRFLAGGTNLLDLMKYEVETADRLIDVGHLPLAAIEPLKDGGLRMGALVRNSDLAANALVRERYPVLAQALLNGASPQLRNMATTGGNLLQRTRCYYFYDTALPCNKREPGSGCGAIGGRNRIHAILGQSPQCIAVNPGDMSVALAILDATVHVQSVAGKREIPILEFHRLPGDHPENDTTLKPGELITHVSLPPLALAKGSHYVKVRDRASFAFALVSVAAALDVRDGHIHEARFALGGVAHKPWRVPAAEQLLVGKRPDKDAFRAAAEKALEGAKGYPDNEFKIELAKRTVVRAFSDILEGRGHEVPGGAM